MKDDDRVGEELNYADKLVDINPVPFLTPAVTLSRIAACSAIALLIKQAEEFLQSCGLSD